MGFCAGVRAICVDFSGWTSAHGLPHIGGSDARWLRWFWTLVTLVSLGFCIYFVWSVVEKYLGYPTSIQTTTKFEGSTFPAVTICHLNPYRVDKLYLLGQTLQSYAQSIGGGDPSLVNLNERYERARRVPYVSSTSNERTQASEVNLNMWSFPFNPNTDMDPEALTIASVWQRNFMQNLNNDSAVEDEFSKIAYTYDDLVMSCIYNTETCNETDFTMKYIPQYGNCYTFNYNGSFQSTRAGPLYGLKLTLRADQSTYLPFTAAAGFRIAIHQTRKDDEDQPIAPDEPYVDAYGLNCATGQATSFGIRYTLTNRLEPPYGLCEQSPTAAYYYDGTFLNEGCFRSCLQDEIVSNCSCYDVNLGEPTSGDPLPCSQSDTDLNAEYYASMLTNYLCVRATSQQFNVMDKCSCPQPCEEGNYMVTVSTSKWPSRSYLVGQNVVNGNGTPASLGVGTGRLLQPTDCYNNTLKAMYTQKEIDNTNPAVKYLQVDPAFLPGYKLENNSNFYWDKTMPETNNETCRLATFIAWYEKNTAQVEIYFERMSYQVMSQESDYDWIALVAEGGGQLGLFLGVSFITLIEFFALAGFICCYGLGRLKDKNKADLEVKRESIDVWHDDQWLENKAEEDKIQLTDSSASDSADSDND